MRSWEQLALESKLLLILDIPPLSRRGPHFGSFHTSSPVLRAGTAQTAAGSLRHTGRAAGQHRLHSTASLRRRLASLLRSAPPKDFKSPKFVQKAANFALASQMPIVASPASLELDLLR